MTYLTTKPKYGRPVPADVVSRDVEKLAAEAIDRRDIAMQAGDMLAVSGSPVLATMGNRGVVPTWFLGPDTATSVALLTRIPAGWNTFDVIALGGTSAAGAGDVVLRMSWSASGSGDNAAVTTTSGLLTFTAAALEAMVEVPLLTTQARPSSGYYSAQVSRRASEVTDTFTGTWGLTAIILRRVS